MIIYKVKTECERVVFTTSLKDAKEIADIFNAEIEELTIKKGRMTRN